MAALGLCVLSICHISVSMKTFSKRACGRISLPFDFEISIILFKGYIFLPPFSMHFQEAQFHHFLTLTHLHKICTRAWRVFMKRVHYMLHGSFICDNSLKSQASVSFLRVWFSFNFMRDCILWNDLHLFYGSIHTFFLSIIHYVLFYNSIQIIYINFLLIHLLFIMDMNRTQI